MGHGLTRSMQPSKSGSGWRLRPSTARPKSWPRGHSTCLSTFFVVGLPPDTEITQIAADLCGQGKEQGGKGREETGGSSSNGAASGTGAAGDGDDEDWMARAAGASSAAAAAAQPAARNAQQQPSAPSNRPHNRPPSPAYRPSVLFKYPPGVAAPVSDKEVADLCFPHQVHPRKLRRSPSWSCLHEVVYCKQYSREDAAFVFMLKAGSQLPLFGVCCLVEEVVHRPPVLARDRYSGCSAPFRSVLISAPRAYCLLTHYPFFSLHFQVLGIILGMERLHRTVDFNRELTDHQQHHRQQLSNDGTGDHDHDHQSAVEQQQPQSAKRQSSAGIAREAAAEAASAPAAAPGRAGASKLSASGQEQQRPNGAACHSCGTPADASAGAATSELPCCRACGAPLQEGNAAGPPAMPDVSAAAATAVGAAAAAPAAVLPPLSPFPSRSLDDFEPDSQQHLHQQQPQLQQPPRAGGAAGAGAGAATPLDARRSGVSLIQRMREDAHMGSGVDEDARSKSSGGEARGRSRLRLRQASKSTSGSAGLRFPGVRRSGSSSIATGTGAGGSNKKELRRLGSKSATTAATVTTAGTVVGARAAGPGAPNGTLAQAGALPGPAAHTAADGQRSGTVKANGPSAPQVNDPGQCSGSLGSPSASAASTGDGTEDAPIAPFLSLDSELPVVGQSRSDGGGDGGGFALTSCRSTPEAGLRALALNASRGSPQGGLLPLKAPNPTPIKPVGRVAGGQSRRHDGQTGPGAGQRRSNDEQEGAHGASSSLPYQARDVPGQQLPGTSLAVMHRHTVSDASVLSSAFFDCATPSSPSQQTPVLQHQQRSQQQEQGAESPFASAQLQHKSALDQQQQVQFHQYHQQQQQQQVTPSLQPRTHRRSASDATSAYFDCTSPASAQRQLAALQQQPAASLQQPAASLQQPAASLQRAHRHTSSDATSAYFDSPLSPASCHLPQDHFPAPDVASSSAAAAQAGEGRGGQQEDTPGAGCLGPAALDTQPQPPAVLLPPAPAAQQHPQKQEPLQPAWVRDASGGGSRRHTRHPSGASFCTAAEGEGDGGDEDADASSRGAAADAEGRGSAAAVAPGAPTPPVAAPAVPTQAAAAGGSTGGGAGGGSGDDSAGSQFSPLAVLDAFYAASPAHPGDALQLPLGGLSTLQHCRPLLPRKFTIIGPPAHIMRYADAELCDSLQLWTAAALVRSLSLDNILTTLTSALLERQLVFFCPRLPQLSACVLSLLPLLRPYAWQCLLLPVTPASMTAFLEAPVPFVLGVQYKTAEVTAKCGSLVRVNVYKDCVKNAAYLPALPGGKQLAAALAPHYARLRSAGAAAGGASTRPVHVLTPDEEEAAAAFLSTLQSHLSTCLLPDLRPHVITHVGGATRTAALMRDSLLEATLSKDRPFVRAFIDTQIFSAHSDAFMAAVCEGRDSELS